MCKGLQSPHNLQKIAWFLKVEAVNIKSCGLFGGFGTYLVILLPANPNPPTLINIIPKVLIKAKSYFPFSIFSYDLNSNVRRDIFPLSQILTTSPQVIYLTFGFIRELIIYVLCVACKILQGSKDSGMPLSCLRSSIYDLCKTVMNVGNAWKSSSRQYVYLKSDFLSGSSLKPIVSAQRIAYFSVKKCQTGFILEPISLLGSKFCESDINLSLNIQKFTPLTNFINKQIIDQQKCIQKMQYLIKVKISQLSFYIPPNINIYSDFRRKSKLPSDGNPQFPQSKMSEIMGFTFSIHFDSINYKTILYNLQNQKYLTMRKTGWMQVRIVIENEKNLQIEKNQKSISVTLNALRKSGLRQQYACTIIDTVSLISQLSHKTGKKKSFTYPCTKNGQIIGQLKVKAIVQSKKQVQNSQLQSLKQKINIQKDAQDQNQRCGIVLSKRQIKVSLSQSTMQAIYFQDLSPIKKIQHNCIQKRVESEDQQQIMDALKENSVTMNIQKKFRQRETQQLQESEASIDLLSKIDLLNRKFEDAQAGQNISEIYNLQGQGKHQEQNRDRKDSQLILSQSSDRQPFIGKEGHDGIRQQQCWTQQSSFYSFRNSFSQDIS